MVRLAFVAVLAVPDVVATGELDVADPDVVAGGIFVVVVTLTCCDALLVVGEAVVVVVEGAEVVAEAVVADVVIGDAVLLLEVGEAVVVEGPVVLDGCLRMPAATTVAWCIAAAHGQVVAGVGG